MFQGIWKPTQRSVDKNCAVEFCGRGCNVDGLHLLEASERMTLWHQLGDRPLVEGAGDQQDDVVDHVAVGYVVQERCQIAWMSKVRNIELKL